MNFTLTATSTEDGKQQTASVKAYRGEEAKDEMVKFLLGRGWKRSEIDREAFMLGTTGKAI